MYNTHRGMVQPPPTTIVCQTSLTRFDANSMPIHRRELANTTKTVSLLVLLWSYAASSQHTLFRFFVNGNTAS